MKLHIFVIGLFWLSTSPLLAFSKKTSKETEKQLTENILSFYNQKQYKRARNMLSPAIKKELKLPAFRRQFKLTYQILGKYQKGSLKRLSKLTIHGRTRFIWWALFKREMSKVIILFDQKRKVLGFVIQSRKLTKAMRQKTPISLTSAQIQSFKLIVDTLMNGYNLNQWKQFCKYCTPLMKQVYSPIRFRTLRKVLWQSYGVYHSAKFENAHKLAVIKGLVIVHFKAHFSKRRNLTIQVVFRQQNGHYRTTSWHLK